MTRRRTLSLLSALLFTLLFANFYSHLTRDFLTPDSPPPPDPVTVSLVNHPNRVEKHLAIREALSLPSPAVTESVLFPDWDVFVLLPPDLTRGQHTNLSCLFADGATSAANYTDRIPSSARHGFLCKMPRSARRLRPLCTPKFIGSGPDSDPIVIGSDRSTEMIRWTHFAYESLSTADDVIVFAKGINRNQGKDRHEKDVSCVFSVNGAVTAVTPATSSAQEVFRCPHPSNLQSRDDDDVRVSVKISGQNSPVPSLAAYRPLPIHDRDRKRKSLTCACTMVYNAAKFLREWVSYHDAIGVDKFILYDNGSDDDLSSVLTQLNDEGHDVSSVYWPWQKTQEAGFSHCAAAQRSTCTWMAFLDVDEFLYSPSWSESLRPNKSMISSLIGLHSGQVGQVQVTCVDFGPSGQRAHPPAGVTQGYTCRQRGDAGRLQRHKSIVRLEAVGPALRNSVHHFEMGPGWVNKRGRNAVVNHYKYQAWSEFRLKFRRRVSAYVADWKERRNVGSNDRTPGLGFAEVEPRWWASGRCAVRDTGLREVIRRWFVGPDRRFAWELDF